jgi:hypothetical protein
VHAGSIYHCFGERTFNYSSGQGIDSSGAHYLNLADLLTTRGNGLESLVGMMNFYAALKNTPSIQLVASDGNSAGSLEVDNSVIGFFGHSLGAINGTLFTALEADQSFPSVLANPGGENVRLLLGSPGFSAYVKEQLKSDYGVAQGTRAFQNAARVGETINDPVDADNYAPALAKSPGGPLPASQHPIDLIEVIGNDNGNPPDQTVPNNVLEPPYISEKHAIQPAPLAGTDPMVAILGLKKVHVTTPVNGQKAIPGFAAMQFTEGGHSTVVGAPPPSATAEMQCEAAGFLASGGKSIALGCASAQK